MLLPTPHLSFRLSDFHPILFIFDFTVYNQHFLQVVFVSFASFVPSNLVVWSDLLECGFLNSDAMDGVPVD